ncbi:hypothetical protein D3C73_1223120 [compost metagenome]
MSGLLISSLAAIDSSDFNSPSILLSIFAAVLTEILGSVFSKLDSRELFAVKNATIPILMHITMNRDPTNTINFDFILFIIVPLCLIVFIKNKSILNQGVTP